MVLLDVFNGCSLIKLKNKYINPFHANVPVGFSNKKMLNFFFLSDFNENWQIAKFWDRGFKNCTHFFPIFSIFVFIFVSVSQESLKNLSKLFVSRFKRRIYVHHRTFQNNPAKAVHIKLMQILVDYVCCI